MAENISIATTASTTIATDEVGGLQYPRIKISVGADGAATDMTSGAGAVAAGTPRVTLASDDPAVAAIGSTNTKLNGGLPAALAAGGGLKVTVQDTSGAALDYSVPALVEGGTAHDSAMSTRKPVAVGGLAKTALPTAVSDGDISHLMLDRMGRVIARAVLEESLGDLTTDVTAGPTNIVAADASNKNRLYGLVLANTNTTNSVKCVVKDDTTTRLTFQIPAGETRGFMVPPDAGMAQAAVNKAWTLTNTGTSPTVTATALFVKAGA